MPKNETKPLPIPSWLIVDAVRYALWRQNFIDATTDWLVEHWRELPQNAREVIQFDLEDAFSRDDVVRREGWKVQFKPLGSDAQRRHWERVRALYSEHVGCIGVK